jgi:hypothetical protein
MTPTPWAVRSRARRALSALLGLASLPGGGCAREPPLPAPTALADAGTPAPAPAKVAFVDDPVEPIVPSTETVTIRLVADARRQAQVFWGRKLLGVAPLELERPRGSGPLDLLVVAPGYLPLHTRVFTDRDEVLALRLYSDKEAAGLLGYTAPKPPNTE